MTNHKASCFYGEQLSNDSIEKTSEISDDNNKFAKIQSHSSVASPKAAQKLSIEEENMVQLLRHKRAHNRRSNPHHDHVPSDEMDLLIETINSEESITW